MGQVTGPMHHEVFQWTLPATNTGSTVLAISIHDVYDGLQRRINDGFSVQVERLWDIMPPTSPSPPSQLTD